MTVEPRFHFKKELNDCTLNTEKHFLEVCVYGRPLVSGAGAPSSSLHRSDIFFSLTGVCGGPRNSSAHIATLTSLDSLHPHFTIQFEPPLRPPPPPPPPPSTFFHSSVSSASPPSFPLFSSKKPQMKKSAARRANLSQRYN